jgi:2-keto-4-pentenoate hydratase/2-oxohepta-3-ene-1,7-dioic acid hydratase in catechol pathway
VFFDGTDVNIVQGTTIPAYTAVMTGTPAGVGAFMRPKTFLNNGDVVEVVLPGVGELRNKIVFQ